MRLFCLILLSVTPAISAQIQLEAEGGRVWTGRADVRIPNQEGTRFSFVDDLRTDDAAYFRLRFGALLRERHRFLVTWAPLEVEAAGEFGRETRFADTLFPEGTPVTASYGFDNYRFTYRYRLEPRGPFRPEVGATLFVRDAEIRVRSGDLQDADDDLGFVPLLSGRLEADLAPGWMFVVDGDALFGPQGRALDLLLALEAAPCDALRIGLGYRILEGGADVDEVYTFALFHHLALTLNWKF